MTSLQRLHWIGMRDVVDYHPLGEDQSPFSEDATGSHNGTRPAATMFKSVLMSSLPSFCVVKRPSERCENSRSDSVEYLNGLRGFASLIVAIEHVMGVFHPNLLFGYGMGIDHHRWLLQLPIVRIIYSGNAMVAIFFVISGYALSYRPLQHIRRKSLDKLQTTISSSIFRRWLRLYIPTLASSFLVLLGTRLGFYNQVVEIPGEEQGKNISIFPFMTPPRLQSFPLQLVHWMRETQFILNPWTWQTKIPDLLYGVQLWTIPVEFRCSMVLFLVTMGLCQARSLVRLGLLGFLAAYCMLSGRWDVFCFLGGMFLAEVTSTGEAPSDKEVHSADIATKKGGLLHQTLWLPVFLAGLFLASQPEFKSAETFGFVFLSRLVPSTFEQHDLHRFWLAVAAVLIVGSISQVRLLQRPLTTGLAKYLGNISFSLYLLHAPIMNSLGYWLLPKLWELSGTSSSFEYELGYFLTMCIVFPTVLWASDVFWRGVDVPSVRFSRGLESKCLVQHHDHQCLYTL